MDVWQEIIGNCDTRISMGTTDVLTARYFSESLGISSVESASIRKSASIEGKLAEYGQENISTLKRNLLNVDEILRLPSNNLLVLLRGNKPIILDKVFYKEHPISKKLKNSSISEYKSIKIEETKPKAIEEIVIQEKVPEDENEFTTF